ncbi:MAG TPA: hypothetical protein VGH20_11425 [Myxococcales bacterium]|jgi:hypothetical protein
MVTVAAALSGETTGTAMRDEHAKGRTIVVDGIVLSVPDAVSRGADFMKAGRNESGMWGVFNHASGRVQVSWTNQGQISTEQYFDSNGDPHGPELSRYENGDLEWEVPWVRGVMNGVARQYDQSGSELFRSPFVDGCGLDLWVGGGHVVELREFVGSVPHGVERWGHPLMPYEEGHFVHGCRFGIVRAWRGQNLAAGYPKFYLDDVETSAAEYATAARDHSELPAYRVRDDRRVRALHPGLARCWFREDITANLMKMPLNPDAIGCGAPDS